MWSIPTSIIFLTTVLVVVRSVEIIHDTDYLPNAQYFDCLHYTNEKTNTYSIKYCIQPKNSSNFQRRTDRNGSTDCDNGAIAHSFSSLFEKGVHPSIVFSTFQSGIEQADRYGTYFFRQQMNDSSGIINDDFICNCSSLKGAFGRYCEYELYVGSTLDDIIRETKINYTKDYLLGQLQRRRVCYISIDCDYGLLCLDWREICNRAQNCMDGLDEENCDEMEMNECAKNEFRCQNGLCIPEEYWLDGELDCQDASDELYQLEFEDSCSDEKGIECDEHVCQIFGLLPCGDGKCSAPLMFIKSLRITVLLTETFGCSTLRDIAFQCELHESLPLWTLANGFCMMFPVAWGVIEPTVESACEFFLKCRLSRSLSTNCPTNDTLSTLLNIECKSMLDRIKYPAGPLLGPRTYTFYKPDHQLKDGFLPDYVIINGQLRCNGFHLTVNNYEVPISTSEVLGRFVSQHMEWFLCNVTENSTTESQFIRNYSAFAPHFDISCWYKWLPLLNLSSIAEVAGLCSHFCLSPHRIHDGISDCINNLLDDTLDETTIAISIEHSKSHCLHCITHKRQAICLPTRTLNSDESICAQGEDTYIAGTSVAIEELKCTNYDASECHIIRDYISQYSLDKKNVTVTTQSRNLFKVLPFGQYCDTYFDTETDIDESVEHCLNKWSCARNEYRCITGQCIPFDWLCDGEWDCSDASDEQGLFLQVNDFDDEHNKQLLNYTKTNFTEIKRRCFERYREQAFSNICNITLEYPCLLANVDDPLNFASSRPCIKLEQIGDKRVDCLGKSDERNLLKCDSDVLGWRFGCTDTKNTCVHYIVFCIGFFFDCPSHDKRIACFYKNDSNCNGLNDVLCLNGICQRNARCDRKLDCPNGEDEYWCYFSRDSYYIRRGTYRRGRRMERQYRTTLTIYLATSNNQIYRTFQKPSLIDRFQQIFMTSNAEKRSKTIDSYSDDDIIIDLMLKEIRNDSTLMLGAELPFICNRGIPIKNNDGRTQCLCSPSHYGDYCEFQADRLSIVTHLNLTKYNGNYAINNNQNSSIFVSCTFHYADQIIDRHDFHIQSITKRVKQKFYFAYPRITKFQEQKRTLRNGTKLYTIRFEAFYLQPMIYPLLLAVWHFPIQFDFLPAFRFAQVLHFNETNQNYSCNLNCNSHGKCFRLENEINKFVCSCHSGWYGDRCDQFEEQCNNFCHLNALCRPQERGIINGDNRPVCLCPHGWFGPTCHLTYPKCPQCQNGGSCYLTYDRSHIRPFQCICPDDFYGDDCQFPKHAVLLRFDESFPSFSKILATSIQYYDVDRDLFDLYLRDQKVYIGRPLETHMKHGQDNTPSMILIKSYTIHHQLQGPIFHLIYSQQNSKALINMTIQLSTENECAHTHTLFDSKIVQNMTADVLVFKYHELCHSNEENRSSIVCFRDDHYFCLCNMTMERAQCLRFHPDSDTCDHCLSGGECIRGNLQQEQDFICLCPRCTYGSVCQFSAQLFSFTLDSLIIKDVESQRDLSIGIYVFIISLALLIGIFNNVCSLFVFSRKTPRQVGVGNYLLLVSIVNIISLGLVFGKMIHILLGSAGLLMNNQINLICCKLFSSLLLITVRINYWLMSLITIERLCSVIFPTKSTIKKPNVALVLSIITILILCGMHVHEFLYYIIISANPQQINFTALLCVANFEHRIVSVYNYTNVLIHHLAPFVIQIIAITLLIVWAARSRAKATSSRTNGFLQILKKQFRTQKELYITPGVIIFAALPQLIFTSSFVCTELNYAWQRYGLLIAYLFSFIPQLCGFVIFVLPSSSYTAEFKKTKIGQTLLCVKKNNQNHARPLVITNQQQTRPQTS